MTKYLSLNGTSDYIQTPAVTFNEIIMDYKSYQSGSGFKYHIDARTASTGGLYLYSSSGIETLGGVTYTAYVNGVQISSGQDSIPTDQRLTLKVDTPSIANPITFFSRYTFIQLLQADVYDIKLLLDGVVQAHYDMSTGTVNDQSGNGYNATLHGGTWLDSGGATGTPVTYTYDTKQTIYKNINLNADTKQSIYANRLTNYDTKQVQYKPIQTSYDSKQVIYKAIQELFDTEQIFTQSYTQVTYNYDMRIEQYKPIQESLDTKQAIYKDISVNLDTKQIVYKQIQNLYDTLIQLRNEHDETIYATLTIQRVVEQHLKINKGHEDTLKIERTLNHILRI